MLIAVKICYFKKRKKNHMSAILNNDKQLVLILIIIKKSIPTYIFYIKMKCVIHNLLILILFSLINQVI
jgi:hypothetical protein